MYPLKTLKVLFVLAAMLIVVKPFLGFDLIMQSRRLNSSNSILVKAFTKRKPENLDEAQQKQTAIAQLLRNPVHKILLSIFFFIGLILPAVLRLPGITVSTVNRLFLRRLPDHHGYLLVGKLII